MNIAVLVSGGVDSSVALRLLQEQGHQLPLFILKSGLKMSFLFWEPALGKRIWSM